MSIHSHSRTAAAQWEKQIADKTPCRASDQAEFKDEVHFVQIDVDELAELSQDLGIRAMPTFLFFKGGDKVNEVVGANPPALLQALRKL